jgi:pimeloyl-ACP methyl ester carboxylesterase/predicted glycosyltransferase
MTTDAQDRAEQTRARYPDGDGYVKREGVRIAWERYGSGERAIVLLPTWEIAHSRLWKFQIPFLAQRFTVITFDPRGNGRSDRPAAVGSYDRAQRTRDTRAVLDAAGVQRATLVSWCGAGDDLAFAVEYPQRTEALILIAPDLLLTHTPNEALYDTIPEWGTFVEAFFAHVFTEPHSTKQVEDGVGWGMATDAETILRGLDATWNNEAEQARALLARVRCPTLVIQGSEDEIAGPARGPAIAAEIRGSELVMFEGSGHGPQLRDPVRFNLAIEDFITDPGPAPRRWVRGSARRRRALYVSSPIGLGHARRDLAIADELRRLRPDLEIDWLAQHPVTSVLEPRGERIHPASAQLANESSHIQAESHGHDLHCFQALRRMDEILLANFMVFLDVVQAEQYDVWIGDEAWDVDYYLHENPELKSAAYVWLTDFVGYLPMPDGGEHEAFLTTDHNAEMIEQIARYPRIRDRSIFVGEPEDIVPDSFGDGLPSIREWTEQHFSFSGYITGFDAAQLADRPALRAELGYCPGEQVCMVTVGGSGVGADVLRRVIASFPEAKRLVPRLRMIVVAGPRIDPAGLPAADGLEIRRYVPDLHRHLAACDLAIVQGGLTTGMELIATGRPFLYFPLGHHFEQQFHVAHRLERYGATGRMDFDDSPPEAIAAAIAREIGRQPEYRPVTMNGAARAATLIDSLL